MGSFIWYKTLDTNLWVCMVYAGSLRNVCVVGALSAVYIILQ